MRRLFPAFLLHVLKEKELRPALAFYRMCARPKSQARTRSWGTGKLSVIPRPARRWAALNERLKKERPFPDLLETAPRLKLDSFVSEVKWLNLVGWLLRLDTGDISKGWVWEHPIALTLGCEEEHSAAPRVIGLLEKRAFLKTILLHASYGDFENWFPFFFLLFALPFAFVWNSTIVITENVNWAGALLFPGWGRIRNYSWELIQQGY